MDSTAIVSTCIGAVVVAGLATIAYRRLVGANERPGCISLIALAIAWLAALTALLTGFFLVVDRLSG
jgi:ABC-type transport system involved in cytochrome bd biosynthesis fused ATPase/permease subunit